MTRRLAALVLVLAAFLVGCNPRPPVSPDAVMSSSAALSTGGTVVVNGPVACPSGVPPGAACTAITVTCADGADPIGAKIALSRVPGTFAGTVPFFAGGGGTSPNGSWPAMVAAYRPAGLQGVEVLWNTNWEDVPEHEIRTAACRSATVLDWLFTTIHGGHTDRGFCAQGFSGGAAQIGYALTRYGLAARLDYASLLSGPPFARVDYFCDPALYAPGTKACCGTNYLLGVATGSMIDTWEGTTSCATASPLPADIARWTADNLVGEGAVLDYPNTPLEFGVCTAQNPAGGLGSFYYDAVTSTKIQVCGGNCQGEQLLSDPGTFQTVTGNMIANCHPHHGG